MKKQTTNRKSIILLASLCLSIFFLSAPMTHAVTMYIGDVDGFGFGDGSPYSGAYGGTPDINGNGILDPGDVLPDLNGGGTVGQGGNDNFDNRSGAEASDTFGAQWTDVALSITNDNRPGDADDASFTFNFALDTSDPFYGQDHYISLVYADYDLYPMTAVVEGTTVDMLGGTIGRLDGYIWSVYAPVSWNDMLDGSVTININAPNEHYVAFDYAVLGGNPIPEPSTMLLFSTGLGALGLVAYRRKNKK